MKSIAELKQEAEHRFNQYKSGPKAKWTEPQKVCKEELGFYNGDSEGIFDVYRAFKYPDSGEFIPFLGVSEPQELEFEIRFVTSSAKSEIEEQECYDFNIGRLPLGFVLKKQIKTNKLILDFNPALKSMHTTDVFQLKPCAKPQSARNADMSIAKRKRRKDLLAEVDISLRIYEGLDELSSDSNEEQLSSDSNEEHRKKHREICKRKKLKKLIIEAYFGKGINEVLNCDYLLLNSDFLYCLRRIHGYTLEQIEFFTKLHGYRIKAKYSLQAMLDAFDIFFEEMQEKMSWYKGDIEKWNKEHPIAIMDRIITVSKHSEKKISDLSCPHYGTYYYCQYEADAKIDGGQIITTKLQKAIEGKNLRVVERIERCLEWIDLSFNALRVILDVCVMPEHTEKEFYWDLKSGRPPNFAELTYELWVWIQVFPTMDIRSIVSYIYTKLIMHDLCCSIAWQSSHRGIHSRESKVINSIMKIDDVGMIIAILLKNNIAIRDPIKKLGSSEEARDRDIYERFMGANAIKKKKDAEAIASKKALQKGNTTKHNTSLIKEEFRYNYLKLGEGIFFNLIGNIGLLSCFYDPTKQLSGFSCLKAISCTALMYRFNTNLLTQHPGKYDVIGAIISLLLGELELIALIKAGAPEIPLSKFGQNRFSEFMWDFVNQPWLGKCPKQYCYMASAATAFTTVIAFAKYYRTTEEGTVNYNLDRIEIIIDKVNSWVWGTSKQEPQDTVAPGVR